MNHPKEKCWLCLNYSNSQLISLFSKSGENSTYFDKMSSTLTQLADVLNKIGRECSICVNCCYSIETVYEFNCSSINNVKIMLSEIENRERVEKEQKEETPSFLRTLLVEAKNHQNKNTSEKIFVKSEPHFGTLIKDDVELKQEVQDVSNLTANCQDSMEITVPSIINEFDEVNEIIHIEEKIDIEECITVYPLSKSDPLSIEKGNDTQHVKTEKILTTGENSHDDQEWAKTTSSQVEIVQDKQVVKSKKTRFECKDCGKVFKLEGNLNNHSGIHSGLKDSLTCDVCQKLFISKCALSTHKKIHTDNKPYVCDVCNKRFRNKSHLDTHKAVHIAKQFCCDVCGKLFSLEVNLNIHMRHHTGYKPYVCEICKKAFTTYYSYTSHKLIHSGEKPYSCDVCGKAFLRKRSLVFHRDIHTGTKRYTCEICNKKFRQRKHYVEHKRLHTGEKPHYCKVCFKSYAGESSLRQHKISHRH